MRFRLHTTVVVSMLAMLAGCGGSAAKRSEEAAAAKVAQDERALVDLSDPAQPVPAERFAQPDAAHIAPGDLLEMRVLGFPELSGTFLVAQDGRVNLSLIGSVQASGKSAEELDRDLTSALGTYYRNLDVAVNVQTRAEREVYVFGEVTKPGRIEFRTGERVVHALADAGGPTEKAREDSVILLRREQDGRDHVYRLDFSQLHTRVIPQDVYLQPGDVVFVPKNRVSTLTDFAIPFLDMLGRAATTALVFENLNSRTRSLTVGP